MASAVGPTDVSFAFSSDGSTVTNTITNNSGTPLTCSTSVAAAPGGVLPAVTELSTEQLYESGTVATGTSTQTVRDIPDGSYVALGSCGRAESDPALWVSSYPGVNDVLRLYPYPAYEVQEASPIVVLPAGGPVQIVTDFLRQLGAAFGS
ncbi:hypothetical protein GCM10007304_32490 [Rhodococcoides trifolii]|uniref:Uncharacterized protein n=1 Tax=Rhodococcoides trifolii TaxID=908250 RepID=A0A917G019_9NOCA|nr:hypothetical protein GCM10007304_32490 [Rhodococcus trifolii]